MYSIHGRIGPGQYDPIVPLVFALMRKKNEKSYKDLFEQIIIKAEQNEVNLNPYVIISDFESAAMSAARQQFDGVRIQGCHFHLGQSILRKIQEFGLITRYNNEENFSVNLRKLAALA